MSWFYKLSGALGFAGRRFEGRQDTGGAEYSEAGQSVTWDSALKLSPVWACVKLLSEIVGAMPINFYRLEKDGTRIPYPDHPLAKLLNTGPNRYQTRNEFFETQIINLELGGNCYGRVTRKSSGEIISIMPMMAQQTEVDLTDDGDRIYKYTNGTDLAVYGQESIWHVPLMPSNGVIGLSPLQYAANTMGISISAEKRVSVLAANGFKPTGVLTIDKILSEEQRERIRKQFKGLSEGGNDYLRVLEAGMAYQPISINPKDAQLLETRRFSIEDIARIYGVPSVLINDTSATTTWGSGIGEIKEGFYTTTLQPLLEKIEASIKKWLIAPDERDKIVVEFDFTSFLRGNAKTRIETGAAAIQAGIKTINEVRKDEGLPPVNGGGQPYMQAQMRTLEMIQQENGNDAPQTTKD